MKLLFLRISNSLMINFYCAKLWKMNRINYSLNCLDMSYSKYYYIIQTSLIKIFPKIYFKLPHHQTFTHSTHPLVHTTSLKSLNILKKNCSTILFRIILRRIIIIKHTFNFQFSNTHFILSFSSKCVYNIICTLKFYHLWQHV